jgi:type VI secretion system protein ImpM
MRCGLFGKLPAKRDFVAVGAPRAFLRLVEPWLDRCLTESRMRLPPEEWAHAFASAPAWRFWLSEELCHRPVLGALVPSVDACGRLFPLTLFGVAEGREWISPPCRDPHSEWFARAETFLGACVDPHAAFEVTPPALNALAVLHDSAAPVRADEFRAGDLRADDEALRMRMAHLVAERKMKGLASRSFWWTLARDAAEPLVLIAAEMPDPAVFAQMVTVRHMPHAEPETGVTS